jgi:SAM-dependent methyltransferase
MERFDAATICVSIQCHVHPVDVIPELGRVACSGGPLVITFWNRCFPTKAVAIWQALDDSVHARLIERYLDEARNWRDIQSLDRKPQPGFSDPLLAIIGRANRAYGGYDPMGAGNVVVHVAEVPCISRRDS